MSHFLLFPILYIVTSICRRFVTLFWGKAKTIGDKVKWSVEKEGFAYLEAHLLRI